MAQSIIKDLTDMENDFHSTKEHIFELILEKLKDKKDWRIENSSLVHNSGQLVISQGRGNGDYHVSKPIYITIPKSWKKKIEPYMAFCNWRDKRDEIKVLEDMLVDNFEKSVAVNMDGDYSETINAYKIWLKENIKEGTWLELDGYIIIFDSKEDALGFKLTFG